MKLGFLLRFCSVCLTLVLLWGGNPGRCRRDEEEPLLQLLTPLILPSHRDEAVPVQRGPEGLPSAVFALSVVCMLIRKMEARLRPLGTGPDQPGNVGNVRFLAAGSGM